MTPIPLQVLRDPYTECGEFMFLEISIQQILKHGIHENYCNLFSTALTVTEGYTVVPCDACSSISEV